MQPGKQKKRYLLASDFDQTLSYNDSGIVLSELIGASDFEEKVRGLARQNLVQQGAELAYLIRHDPEFRRVRRDHLIDAGKAVRLKSNVQLLAPFLNNVSPQHEFLFYVISAAPQEVVESALEGIVPADCILGTRFEYGANGEIDSVLHSRAGYGKVAAIDSLRSRLNVAQERVIYVGDGSSDVHVMLHVNRLEGLTIAVSENRHLRQVARRTVLSDDALSLAIPVLEEIVGLESAQITRLLEEEGFVVREWDKLQTDSVSISRS